MNHCILIKLLIEENERKTCHEDSSGRTRKCMNRNRSTTTTATSDVHIDSSSLIMNNATSRKSEAVKIPLSKLGMHQFRTDRFRFLEPVGTGTRTGWNRSPNQSKSAQCGHAIVHIPHPHPHPETRVDKGTMNSNDRV